MLVLDGTDHSWNKGMSYACTRYPFSRKRTKTYSRLLSYENYGSYICIESIVLSLLGNRKVYNFLKEGIIVPLYVTDEKPFNPVNLIAEYLGHELLQPVNKNLLQNIFVDTTEELPADEKAKSRKHPVYVVPQDKEIASMNKSERIILFDDVIDTGGTLENAASVLRENGFTNIDVFTICYSRRAYIKNR